MKVSHRIAVSAPAVGRGLFVMFELLGDRLLHGKITSYGFLPPIHCKSAPGIISSYPCL
jgi:hypothetical protein